MPTKVGQACVCGGTKHDGKCDRCGTERRTDGGQWHKLYGKRWQAARAAWIATYPLCVECERQGRTTAATDVDHITPHRGNMERFWDVSNWQALCASCHAKKTRREG